MVFDVKIYGIMYLERDKKEKGMLLTNNSILCGNHEHGSMRYAPVETGRKRERM